MVKKGLLGVIVAVVQFFSLVFPLPPNATYAKALWDASQQNTSAHSRATSVSATPLFNGPLTPSSSNRRYFTDGSGKAVYLAGSHTWDNRQDLGSSRFDYQRYLSLLKSYNHNFFRFWVWEQPKGITTTPDPAQPNATLTPEIFKRTGPGSAADGGLKFNLNQYNQAHFDRLRQRVIEAGNQGMYVSVMLFDGWSVEQKAGGANPWLYHPFQRNNNVNGLNGDPNGDQSGAETHSLQIAAITAAQEAYVRKVIDTVNDLDNVLYEISNESGVNSTAWQVHMIDYVHQYEAGQPQQHPVGMTYQWPGGSNNTLFASPADWISPNGEGGYDGNPPVATGNKVVVLDTDHIWGIGGDRGWAWKSFTRGYNLLYMDPWDGHFIPVSANVDLRRNLGYIRSYADRINLLAMTPQPNLCSSSFCLAKATSTAAEYLVYLPTGGSVGVNLSATQGKMAIEWLNPASGETFSGGNISGGTTRTLTAPFSGDAVLYLVSTNVEVYIGNIKQNEYYLAKQKFVTDSYPSLVDGPVKVVSVNSENIIPSQRAFYQNSFNEVMGYPENQFATEYWFPWYDNVSMSTWILVGNPSPSQTAYVNIYVNGIQQGSTRSIPPGGNITPRFIGLMDGPVRVVSVTGSGTSIPIKIFTSERTINQNSFNEVMGYPASQLTTGYWFPWYDNVSMSTWILVGNPSPSQTAYVNIYVGSTRRGGTFSIPPGGIITPRFTGLMDGPVRVISVTGSGTSIPLKVFTSERTVYQNSFNEVMGYPANQLASDYSFPYYDNVSMSTWILVGNPSTSQTAYVNIYVGSTRRGGTFSIPPGGSVTPRFTGLTNGPVRVISVTGSGTSIPLKVFTSQRAIYQSSFNEMMGYPANQLTTKYWFTWYDSTSMNTSVIIGKP